jgi:hypothetical protein
MGPQDARLSLHLHRPTHDLAVVCAALGLAPQHIWKAADERRTPTGTKIGGFRDSSYCSIEFGVRSREPLSERFDAALVLLRPHRAILRELSSGGGRAAFYIGWFCDEHTGDALPWKILEEMSDLRIDLELNLYIPDERASNVDEA